MKRALIVMVIILLFLVLLAAILFKVFNPTSSNTTSGSLPQSSTTQLSVGSQAESPTDFAIAFYTWYLTAAIKDPAFPTATMRSTLLSPWLTQDFISKWDQIASDTDGNPVLQAQEFPTNWQNNIQARVLSQSATSTIVLVSMGTPSLTVLVHLVPMNGGWRITETDLPPS